MYGYILDVFIWSFSIYGFLTFVKEYFLEGVCVCILGCIYIAKLSMNFIVKKVR